MQYPGFRKTKKKWRSVVGKGRRRVKTNNKRAKKNEKNRKKMKKTKKTQGLVEGFFSIIKNTPGTHQARV